MNQLSLSLGVVCLISASLLSGQSSVSLYELSHKPVNQARRLFKKGMAQLKHRNYRSSLGFFQEAAAIDPQYWLAMNNTGYAYLKLDQQKDAAQAFQRAIEIDPLNAIGYTNLGICELSRNHYSKAEEAARRALRLRPDLSEAKALLGIARAAQGDWTPPVQRLLEESKTTVTAAGKLLNRWPANPSDAPRVLVLSSSRN